MGLNEKEDDMRLKERVALITGASRGIGREAALLFAREGAKIAVCDVAESGQDVADEINRKEGEAIFIKTDVTDRNSCQRAAQTAIERFQRIDILINNAGIVRDARLVKMSEEDFDLVVKVNLKGAFNATQAVAPFMIEQGSGKIINVASVVGLYGNFGQTNYVATKAGIIGMTKVWARELGRKGINVNAVAPGFTQTEMTDGVPEKVLQMMREKASLGRLGRPRDIANAYLFLASDESDYVHGAVLSVDGGLIP
jgi:3-oxoacyl-[acyl-carrier protein] reductase